MHVVDGAQAISHPILFFLERIAGDGYGGRADFEIALAEARKLFAPQLVNIGEYIDANTDD